jgi:preprotein translocase subunit SecG
MFVFFTIVHILLCVFMIFVILLQPGKDAGMGAALGGGAATSAFGGRGAATFLTKLTAFCAMGFFVTSLGLSFVGLRSSAADDLEETPAVTTPSTTTPPAPSAVPSPEAAPSTPTEAAPTAPPAANTGSAADSVPAEKLPAK